jgi:DNA mismatch repair ATPase MutS
LTHLSELRHSSIGGLFQVLLLWDFHVLAALERWRSRSGSHAREWLKGLGEVEALSALAGLAHDNPEWSFPEMCPEQLAGIVGTDVGHPLLRGDKRVVNDIELGPARTFLLVTGSNMSGKSTLLRAIGLNVVMAQAGGVVCASRFRMPTVRLFTSMRIRDSIEHGVSYFMAGLVRLRSIVTAARAHSVDDGAFLYLLDEVLQGTNSAERHVAVCRIVGELISLDTLGAVTTHDLALADAEELKQACRPVHFTETIEVGGDGAAAGMSFDYRLRPGVATSTNALRLLELMGIRHRQAPRQD